MMSIIHSVTWCLSVSPARCLVSLFSFLHTVHTSRTTLSIFWLVLFMFVYVIIVLWLRCSLGFHRASVLLATCLRPCSLCKSLSDVCWMVVWSFVKSIFVSLLWTYSVKFPGSAVITILLCSASQLRCPLPNVPPASLVCLCYRSCPWMGPSF